MELTLTDLMVFLGFLGTVVVVSLYAGRKEQTSEDYFLAGRKLTWPLIGFSLIASNISTEHFVGMAGSAFGRVGLAIASYEWMAAVTLILVGWFLLPKFLKAGIYTMPEFLEYRYSPGTRAIMATYIMVAYIVVLLAVVLYSGALAFNAIFGVSSVVADKFKLEPERAELWANLIGIWGIGLIAATYTIYGGLKAVVWSDLLQGGALLLGGAIVTILGLKVLAGFDIRASLSATFDGVWVVAFIAGLCVLVCGLRQILSNGQSSRSLVFTAGGIGLMCLSLVLVRAAVLIEGWKVFTAENAHKLHMVLPWNDPDVPWVAVFIGGLWIPNIFYWGCNQFITQRTLGAKSLAEGQKGIVLAAAIKLCIPFIIVIPGIMALHLYGDQIRALGGNVGDKAYPYLISQILPPQLRGVMFAALLGAVMSTFNSGLNSASTIFTIDIYRKYINKTITPKQEVTVGRIATAVIVVVACLWAPIVGRAEGVFKYIQEIWGFISPGIVTAFLIGLVIRKAPAVAARAALLLGPVLYAFCRVPGWVWNYYYTRKYPEAAEILPPEGFWGAPALIYKFSTWAFLHHMGLIFLVLSAMMVIITVFKPLNEPVVMPTSELDTSVHPRTYVYGGLIIALTAVLYIIFW